MEENESKKSDMDATMQEWMKASTDLWTSMLKAVPTSASTFAAPDGGGIKNRYTESLEATLKRMQSASSALNDPQMADAILKGLNTLPEFFLKISKAGWEASARLQKKVAEKAGKIGQKTEAYQFENLDQGVFKAWREIYEEEFSQYFQIPQLGLARYYQERLNHLLDQSNILNASLSEFLYLLYLPMEKSMKVFQDKIEDLSKEGNVPDKAKDYYNLWVKILEGHYMNLFKSPEYLVSFREMLSQAENYVTAKNEVLQDILQSLPVPTNRDMDNIYKDLYLLKKRVKVLEKELARKEKK
jgi:polyhydroxyalkanoate synthase subunit PhaE